jgi:hypothetical protein
MGDARLGVQVVAAKEVRAIAGRRNPTATKAPASDMPISLLCADHRLTPNAYGNAPSLCQLALVKAESGSKRWQPRLESSSLFSRRTCQQANRAGPKQQRERLIALTRNPQQIRNFCPVERLVRQHVGLRSIKFCSKRAPEICQPASALGSAHGKPIATMLSAISTKFRIKSP